MECLITPSQRMKSISILPLTTWGLEHWLEGEGTSYKSWVETQGYKAKPSSVLFLPSTKKTPVTVLAGVDEQDPLWSWGGIARTLPQGTYHIVGKLKEDQANAAALGWALGLYCFDHYKTPKEKTLPLLVIPKAADAQQVIALAEAVSLTRDLVNTPANHMGPVDLAETGRNLAKKYGAMCRTIIGEKLLDQNFPMIHAVGRASSRAPRLLDFTWGESSAPKLTLIGKGVCFDSGGLDLKPTRSMLLMKKDMGGAAHVLGLARAIMAVGLKVRLRVLIPAVDNAVSGEAFRPLDVLTARSGMTVEIGNTDAEGRLVLADALTLAAEEKPDLIVDFATLTGASRIAMGTDVPSFFTNEDETAHSLMTVATRIYDPVWRLPLHTPYRALLNSDVADIKSCTGDGYGGAITAALFLQEFVPKDQEWLHFDVMAWNLTDRPGRPKGGEAQGLRAMFDLLWQRYG